MDVEGGKVACKTAHLALWHGLRKDQKGVTEFLTRLTKLAAAEFLSITSGDGEKAAALLNEAFVPAVESEIAFAANDPEIQAVAAVLELLRGGRG